ncbi:MAG: histidinol-phosphatase HisJ family protein [Clostridiaceae bacterium]
MKKIDYHIHSTNSFDGKSTILEMCKASIDNKIDEICFTEHFSIDKDIPTYGFLDFNKYSREIDDARNIFHGRLKIHKGLEICEPYFNKEILKETIKDQNLDFILGSVHNMKKTKLRNYIEGKTNKEVYEGYFKEIYQMVLLSDIDAIAHLDLLKRYAYDSLGNYSFIEHEELIYDILKLAIKRDIAIEINTSGLRCNSLECFPSVSVIKAYKSLGGELITIGSDAHNTKYLSYEYFNQIKLLKSLGFKYIYVYEKRKQKSISLE